MSRSKAEIVSLVAAAESTAQCDTSSARAPARQAHDLRLHGMPLETEFQDVELNGSFQVNGRSPWRIASRWLDPARNELHLFESENLWFDRAPFITSKRITVFIGSKRYSMDVSFLPKLAN